MTSIKRAEGKRLGDPQDGSIPICGRLNKALEALFWNLYAVYAGRQVGNCWLGLIGFGEG